MWLYKKNLTTSTHESPMSIKVFAAVRSLVPTWPINSVKAKYFAWYRFRSISSKSPAIHTIHTIKILSKTTYQGQASKCHSHTEYAYIHTYIIQTNHIYQIRISFLVYIPFRRHLKVGHCRHRHPGPFHSASSPHEEPPGNVMLGQVRSRKIQTKKEKIFHQFDRFRKSFKNQRVFVLALYKGQQSVHQCIQ